MAGRPRLKTFDFNADKFKELIVYIAERCQDDPTFGAVKLNKILYYADFAAYRIEGQPITGATYRKLSEGPAPKEMISARDELIESGRLRMEHRPYFTRIQKRLVLEEGQGAIESCSPRTSGASWMRWSISSMGSRRARCLTIRTASPVGESLRRSRGHPVRDCMAEWRTEGSGNRGSGHQDWEAAPGRTRALELTMPYGRGWELIEPEAFSESVEREVTNDPRVEDMLEGLSFALIMDPTDPSLAFRIPGTLWCAPLSGPPAFLIFSEVSEEERKVTYEFLTRDPSI